MLACHPPSSPQLEETGAEVPENPEIESVSSNCSSTEDKRTVEVQTRGWTGGGRVSFTLDGRNIEEHPLQSVEADAHGQWDTLRVELTIVADPQQVSKGSSTAHGAKACHSCGQMLLSIIPSSPAALRSPCSTAA